jgi:hypothetical protein
MARFKVEECTANRGSDEQANSGDTEAHSEAGANLVHVVREGDDSARGKRNERTGKETVQDGEYQEAINVVYGNPREQKHAAGECARDENVEVADMIC